MTAPLVRVALETALAGMSPALATQYPNETFTVPSPDTPYQRFELMFAEPAAVEMSGRVNREQGFLQLTLCYPLNIGTGDADARAELIRTTFYRGLTLTSGGVNVKIDGMPAIAKGFDDGDRFVVPVRIPFYAIYTRS